MRFSCRIATKNGKRKTAASMTVAINGRSDVQMAVPCPNSLLALRFKLPGYWPVGFSNDDFHHSHTKAYPVVLLVPAGSQILSLVNP